MKPLKIAALFLAGALIFSPAGSAFAMHGGGGMKCCKQHGMDGKYGKHGGKDFLKQKLFHKAHFLLQNQEALGLSEEQVGKIKDTLMAAKKDCVTKSAEIEILALDIRSALEQSTINSEEVNAMIDKKFDLKKAKVKKQLDAYVTVESVLTDDQKAKAKEICKQGCPMSKAKWEKTAEQSQGASNHH